MCELTDTREIIGIEVDYDYEAETVSDSKLSLVDLPVEIILNICKFLDTDFLKHTFGKICRRFAIILADDHIWKHRIHQKVKSCFPALPELKLWEDIDWQALCVEIDTEEKKWKNVTDSMNHIVVRDVHFASVDTVLLVNNGELCVSGGRDRSMALWDVSTIKPGEKSRSTTTLTDVKPKQIQRDAHSGWIWDLTADNVNNASVIYSASWDNTVKAWDLAKEFACVNTFNCGISALSVVYSDNLIMAGLYSKSVCTFDSRAGPNPISSYKPHKGPVLALETIDNMVASISEDKTLAVWDRVAGKLLAYDVKLPVDKAYPVCLNWGPNALYIGDSKGCLHLIDPDNYKYLRPHVIWEEPPDIKPSNKITGCYQSSATVIVCSDRGEIKFMYNSSPPQEYFSVITSTCNLTQLRYLNSVLVIGTCDSALEFWIPSDRYTD